MKLIIFKGKVNICVLYFSSHTKHKEYCWYARFYGYSPWKCSFLHDLYMKNCAGLVSAGPALLFLSSEC